MKPVFTYFGPPGTGKTTTLLDRVEELLDEGVSPKKIGYFAFTRKAAYEARDRASQKFSRSSDDFPFFQTLHSLAFRCLGLSGSDVIKESDLREFAKKEPIGDLNFMERTQDENFTMLRCNEPVMRCIDLARSSLEGPEKAYNNPNIRLNIRLYHFLHIYSEYEKFKRLHGLLDFTDMIINLVKEPSLIPSFHTTFIDEAQDLTPLQHELLTRISESSDQCFAAGDDDQGIYQWAGASISRFLGLKGGSQVLDQSYRIPRAVHDIADRVARRIRRRHPKVWKPRSENGSITHVSTPDSLDFNNGEDWLCLSQARFMMDPLADFLIKSGHYFTRGGNPSLEKKVLGAIKSWAHLNKGEGLSHKDALQLYDHIVVGPNLQRGFKSQLKAADESDIFTLDILRQHFGLTGEGDWQTVLDRIKDEPRAYATALQKRGVNIFEEPKIKISTIHGAKGGEAQNVLLDLSLTGNALATFQKDPDSGHRLLYVGITRAKQNLYLQHPENRQRGWII